MPYVSLEAMFFRQICNIFSRFSNLTILRRLKGILQKCFQGVFYHFLKNYLAKMSKNCLCRMSYLPLYENSFRQPCKRSFTGQHFVEKTLWHGCSPVHLLYTFRTCSCKNTSEGLLLTYALLVVHFTGLWSKKSF